MSTFGVPKGVCSAMDALAHRFQWGTKHHYLVLKSYESLLKPRENEDMDFKCSIDVSTILLSKLGWKLAKGDDGLWVHVLKAKYLRGESFLSASKGVQIPQFGEVS